MEYKILPQPLKKGDKVALVSPSGFVKPEKLQKAVKNVEKLGLIPVYENTFRKYGYLAGTDQQRITELHKFFADKEIKAIFAIRGGYGATRILPYLNYDLIKENPKIFLGFSDITALHLAFYKQSGLVCFHGIVAASDFTDYVRTQLENLLFKTQVPYTLPCQRQEDFTVITPGVAEGVLTGGNLSLLVSLIGTNFQPVFKNNIVLIEEIFEPPYKIDRMLEHLLQATDLSWAAGIILGNFRRCTPQDHNTADEDSLSLLQIFEEKFKPLNIPVVYGVRIGHTQNSCVLPIGIKVSFNTNPLKINILEKWLND